MNRKITFPQLVAALSEATGSDQETASEFLKTIFESISTALAKGETVTVKGLGSFTPGGNDTVTWIPDKQLAASVNEPFEFFEAVELGDGVTEETLTADTTAEEIANEEKSPEIPPIPEVPEREEDDHCLPADIPPVPSIETAGIAEPPTETETDSDAEHSFDSTTLPHDESQTHEAHLIEEEPSSDEDRSERLHPWDDDEEKPRHKRKVHPCIAFVSGLIIGLAAGYFGAMHALDSSSRAIEEAVEMTEEFDAHPEETAVKTDSLTAKAEIADTAKGQETAVESLYLAIDTVTPNRYLTTMSRQYYGDYRFWVYIYEENMDKITNPNRISPGTTVIIPYPEKYGIDSNDRKSLANAEQKSKEIQSRNSK